MRCTAASTFWNTTKSWSARGSASLWHTAPKRLLGSTSAVFVTNSPVKALRTREKTRNHRTVTTTAGAMFSASKNTVACLLLSNRYVPLALTLLGPVIVNILSFHMRLRATARPFVRSRTTPERTTSSARPEAQGEKQAAPAE
jgi:hypothetical protein